MHTVNHKLDMAVVKFHKLRLHKLGGVVVPGNAYYLAAGADGFKHEGNNLVKHTPVNVGSLLCNGCFLLQYADGTG